MITTRGKYDITYSFTALTRSWYHIHHSCIQTISENNHGIIYIYSWELWLFFWYITFYDVFSNILVNLLKNFDDQLCTQIVKIFSTIYDHTHTFWIWNGDRFTFICTAMVFADSSSCKSCFQIKICHPLSSKSLIPRSTPCNMIMPMLLLWS